MRELRADEETVTQKLLSVWMCGNNVKGKFKVCMNILWKPSRTTQAGDQQSNNNKTDYTYVLYTTLTMQRNVFEKVNGQN